MKVKISLISTSLMFILSVSLALATSAYTEYAGSGDFHISTNIISPITPSITDSATIHTGCDGGCCCCPYCAGEYEGTQIVTNNPFSATGHEVTVIDGCIELEQSYVDEYDNRKLETRYYTYFDGTGTAEAYVYAVPGAAMSYQLANGTGSSYVSFSQIVFLDDNFDYSTIYGGRAWVCNPGSVGLMSGYNSYNQPTIYIADLGLYCSPTDESNLNSFLFAKGTDYFGLSSNFTNDYSWLYQDIEVIGSSDYGFSVNTTDNFNFDFEMGLG